MESDVNLLEEIVVSEKDFNNVKHMDDIEGTMIFAGKRNDVIILDKTNANTAENIPRQVFSKVPGVYEWDLDGSGVQTSISVRGLNPHRSWEFNVRQNGYNVNSDMFGYPESHYNPPTEALTKLELVRGGASLQYGPQFGGMLNYVIKEGPTDKKVDFETRQTLGSNGLFNSYNGLGGQIGKLNYFGYVNYRVSDGYRPNSRYTWWAYYAGLHYAFSEKVTMGLSFHVCITSTSLPVV
jgi:Fe(3+) dicitrate transport protein